MATAATPPKKDALATVRGVELFAAGTFDGKTFGEDYIDRVIANHALLSTGDKPLHRPPVVLGHEEDQEWLTRTDLPAAGWVSDEVWKNAEGRMLGDFADVPASVADAINSGAFKKVSCEFYDDFVDNAGNHYGPALRRVALLGAEIPKVKGLADLPHAQFSDKLPAHRAVRVLKFAEGKPVGESKNGSPLQAAVAKMLKDAGLSQPTIDLMAGNEELMAAVLADLTGQTPADSDAADPNAPAGTPGAAMSEKAVKAFSERAAALEKSFNDRAAALERQAKEIQARQDAVDTKTKEAEREQDRKAVYLFAEGLVREKRVAPADLDETDPRTLSLPQRLLALDNVTVHKFSEGGKEVSLTPRQLEMERLRKQPADRRFSEKAAAAKDADKAELDKVEAQTRKYVDRTSKRPAAAKS